MAGTEMRNELQNNRLSACGIGMWLIVAIFYGLDYLQHTMPSVLIMPIAKSIQPGNPDFYITITNIMNIYFPIYALSQIPAGYIIDRVGLRLTLFVASIVLSLGLLAMALPLVHLIVIGRVLIAIGSAFAWNAGLKAAAMYLPKSLFPFMTGLLNSIGVITGIGGMIFINHLIHIAGWEHAIHLVGIFGLVWAAVILIFLRNRCCDDKALENVTNRINASAGELFRVFTDPQLWLVTFYAALITGAVMYTFAESYSVITLEKLEHVTSNKAAWLNSLIFIGVGIGGPLHGIIASQFRNKKTWISIAAFMTFISFSFLAGCIYYKASIDILAIAYFLIGFFVVAMLLSYSIAKERFPSNVHAVIFAFINMMVMLAGFVIPMIFGALIHYSQKQLHMTQGLMLPIFSLLVPIFIAAVLSLFIKNDKARDLEQFDG